MSLVVLLKVHMHMLNFTTFFPQHQVLKLSTSYSSIVNNLISGEEKDDVPKFKMDDKVQKGIVHGRHYES